MPSRNRPSSNLTKSDSAAKEPWQIPITFPESLPINQRRDEIAALIKRNQVVIVAGETGSGKTTQIPKICLSLGYGQRGLIGHTQPRRLAARTVADRIASELKSTLGDTVGYQVRFEDVSTDQTRIKLMTDGVLLAEFQHDHLLRKYEVIIIDEAHERSLNIDFLLGLLKPLCRQRPDLRIIITSATIDLEKFAEHFANHNGPTPIIEVSGRTFPVEIIYQPPPDGNTNLPDLISKTVGQIIRGEAKGEYSANGDILVFCAGEREIRDAAQALRRTQLPVEILPLYSRLSVQEQNKVFKSAHRRKVVLATNVAETSITVPGIAYVIDPGLARISRYSFRSKIQRLPIEPISKASANQRKGRCGRVANGVCIRLYSEDDFNQRDEYTPAEILRSNLASVILKMLRLKIKDVEHFDFIDRPDTRLLKDGYKLLQELGAINQVRKLTPTGRSMSELPIDPKFSRILVAAQKQDCLRDALVLISALSIQDPRERPADKQQTADQKHAELAHPQSDFISFLYLWQAINNAREELSNSKFRQYCVANFWSIARLFEWRELVRQLALQCKRLGWKVDPWTPMQLPQPATAKKAVSTSFDERYEQIHQVLLFGLLNNIATKDLDDTYLAARSRKIELFPGSPQAKRKPKWIVAAEFLETSRLFAHTVGQIKPDWVIKSAGDLLRYSYSDPHYHVRSGTIKAKRKTMLFGLTLREKEPVNYAPINSSEAREVFIQEALVSGRYQPRGNNAPFVEHNQSLIRAIEEIETKTRRRNLLVDDRQIYEFYAQELPENVNNRTGLERWLENNTDALKLNREQLLAGQVDPDSVAQFPDHTMVNDKRVDLEYKFSPGQRSDGVTMIIPISVLAPFPTHIGDWLVPGLLREKCIALIKTLPKPIRRHFAPASDAVDRVLDKLQASNIPLCDALADALFRTRGVKVVGSDFKAHKLDDFYQMNYRVIDVDGSLIEEGRELDLLKQHYADAVQKSVQTASTSERTRLEKMDISSWDFGDIPDSVEYQHDGMTVRAYPMLVTEAADTIALRIHDNESIAQYQTQRGVLALAKRVLSETTQRQALKYLHKEILAPKQTKSGGLSTLASQLNQLDPTPAEKTLWRQELIDAGLRAACFPNGLETIRSQANFDVAIEHGAKKWVPLTTDLEAAFLSAIKLRDQLLLAFNSHNPSSLEIDTALEDIKAQVYRLFEPTFLRYTEHNQLKQYPRFLRAIDARLAKLGKTNPDEAALTRLQSAFDEKVSSLDPEQLGLDYVYSTHVELREFARLLEEWRVSIYAQHLKTQMPVSEKRLQSLWKTIK